MEGKGSIKETQKNYASLKKTITLPDFIMKHYFVLTSGTCFVVSEQCFSIHQEPVVLLNSEQCVPLQEWIHFLFLFTYCNSIWANVQAWAVSLGKGRKDTEEGK